MLTRSGFTNFYKNQDVSYYFTDKNTEKKFVNDCKNVLLNDLYINQVFKINELAKKCLNIKLNDLAVQLLDKSFQFESTQKEPLIQYLWILQKEKIGLKFDERIHFIEFINRITQYLENQSEKNCDNLDILNKFSNYNQYVSFMKSKEEIMHSEDLRSCQLINKLAEDFFKLGCFHYAKFYYEKSLKLNFLQFEIFLNYLNVLKTLNQSSKIEEIVTILLNLNFHIKSKIVLTSKLNQIIDKLN